MKLVNTLQGHLSEVNCIKWLEGITNQLYAIYFRQYWLVMILNLPTGRDYWITGGEDGFIRIWVSFGIDH